MFPVRVSPIKPIEYIKGVLANFTGHSPYCYELKFNSRFLKNEEIINDLNINEDSIIECIELTEEEANAKMQMEEKEIKEKDEKMKEKQKFMEKVNSLVKMGYSKKDSINALQSSSENVKAASALLKSKYKNDTEKDVDEYDDEENDKKKTNGYQKSKNKSKSIKNQSSKYLTKYTPEEDKVILDYARAKPVALTSSDLANITIPGRTPGSIQHRYYKHLKDYVKEYRDPARIPKNLIQTAIALTDSDPEKMRIYFPNLTIEQIKNQILGHKWDASDDKIIKVLHDAFGDDWNLIARKTTIQATPEQIRDRYLYLQKLENQMIVIGDDEEDENENE